MEVLEGLDDVCAHHGESSKAPLVKDPDVDWRSIKLLFGKKLHKDKQYRIKISFYNLITRKVSWPHLPHQMR